MPTTPEQGRWLDGLAPGQFRHLFDHLPGAMFFAKDAGLRLMMGNPAFVERCGRREEKEIVGLTDAELFPPKLADKYRHDDQQVLATGRPLRGLIELFPDASGSPEWFVTDKLPLFDRRGRPCGLCGTVRSYEQERAAMQPYLDLAPAAARLKRDIQQPLDVASLAATTGLSVRQFERKFRETFQMTPRAYLMQMRVIRACELLRGTELPITRIALQAGFYDHSDFARQFARQMGQTATAYRKARRDRA
ncbi:MAG: AraC family transcriptional regulator [Planctomycetota bacterium]